MRVGMKRETIIDKYVLGEVLSEEEQQFLINTSELLNSCVDKQFMQKAANIIDRDVVENMELGLAEDILCEYEEIKLAIKNSRF